MLHAEHRKPPRHRLPSSAPIYRDIDHICINCTMFIQTTRIFESKLCQAYKFQILAHRVYLSQPLTSDSIIFA